MSLRQFIFLLTSLTVSLLPSMSTLFIGKMTYKANNDATSLVAVLTKIFDMGAYETRHWHRWNSKKTQKINTE